MAKPIEATPPLRGKDATRILESLQNCAPPEEIERRRQLSLARLANPTVAPILPSLKYPKP